MWSAKHCGRYVRTDAKVSRGIGSLSIVIPAYNEERTLGVLIDRVHAACAALKGIATEIIVVDDGSTDRTGQIAASDRRVMCVRQPNRGKGAAVQRGIEAASGDYVLIQDADLEYDPCDYPRMLEALARHPEAAVYGSRGVARGKKHPNQEIGAWLANRLLSAWIALLYQRRIADPLTGYKLYPIDQVRGMGVQSLGFEADHEITAKLILRGLPIIEVEVGYHPRSRAEGKKIKAADFFIGLWSLLKYRFV